MSGELAKKAASLGAYPRVGCTWLKGQQVRTNELVTRGNSRGGFEMPARLSLKLAMREVSQMLLHMQLRPGVERHRPLYSG